MLKIKYFHQSKLCRALFRDDVGWLIMQTSAQQYGGEK